MKRILLTASTLLLLNGHALAQDSDMPPTMPGDVNARLYEGAGGELFWQRSTDDRGVSGYELTLNGVSLGVFDALSY